MMRALILFGFLGLFASSAWGECIPVVFAFRHAEDTSYNQLTPTGMAHAELYKSMVSGFEATVLEPPDKTPCRVTKVYSTTIATKPDGNASATNSFNTAAPLAKARMNAAPITTVGTGDGKRELYEYVSSNIEEPTNPNYSNTTATALRKELLATANSQESSAIFWTSQGLHVLGGAIISTDSIGRDSAVPKKDGWTLPPRNAVYLFKAKGSAPITEFDDTPKAPVTDTHPVSVSSTFYVQCFNWVGTTDQPKIGERDADNFVKPDKPDESTQLYYCGWGTQSAVGGKPIDGCNVNNPDPLAKECGLIPNGRTDEIKGKICDTTSLLPESYGKDIFGACRGPA